MKMQIFLEDANLLASLLPTVEKCLFIIILRDLYFFIAFVLMRFRESAKPIVHGYNDQNS
jgi:hypothetical protein